VTLLPLAADALGEGVPHHSPRIVGRRPRLGLGRDLGAIEAVLAVGVG
jgi:hypothetical protein